MTTMIGQLIGDRYQVVALLGDGGVCSVYRAEDKKRQVPVALKVLSHEQAAKPDMAARFKREASVGKRISHPHVVGVTDSGSLDDGSLYLTMELLDGRTLAQILEEGPLPLRRAVEITRQILSGL